MWAWLRAHATPLYDSYWTNRGLDEFERIFKRKPFKALEGALPISQAMIEAAMNEHIRRICIHFGEGRLNPSTIAWVMFKVEQSLIESTTPPA